MKISRFSIWFGIAAAAGAALGVLADRRHPVKGGVLGAALGVAGSVATAIYRYKSGEKVPYYSESSALYGDVSDSDSV